MRSTLGPRKSKKTAPKSKRSEEAAADSNPKKKAKSEPAPAAREPDVHKMKWDHLWKEFAEADNPGEMTLEGFADLLEKADIDCTSAPALVLCWKLDFKLRNSSQVVQHDDYSGYFRFDRETVGGLKRELETSRFDAASLDIDEFRCECARARARQTRHARTHTRAIEPHPSRRRRAASSIASRSSSSASRRRRASSATCSSRSSRSCSQSTRPAPRASAARSRPNSSPSSKMYENRAPRGVLLVTLRARARRVPQLEGDAHESLTFDEWTQFLEFSLTHAHDPKCKEYDEAAAWPLLIDDFVDYIQRDGKAKK